MGDFYDRIDCSLNKGARKKFKKKIQCRKARKGFDGCTDWFVGRCSICLILTCIQCGMMFCCGCICCSCSCSCKKEAKRKVNKPKNLKDCIKVLDNESEKRKTILFELVIRDGTIRVEDMLSMSNAQLKMRTRQ